MTKMQQKISVIIPCYNVEKYIDRCLQSVVDQTYPMRYVEIICVNDASTDGTMKKLTEWEQRYPENILVIDCEVNGHLGKARNTGVGYATGDWIAFIDSDDWIEKDYLETLIDAAVSGHYQVVACKDIRDSSDELTYFDNGAHSQTSAPVAFHINSTASRKEFFRNQPLKLYAWGRLINREFMISNELFFPEHLAYEDIVWGNLVNMYVEHAALIDRAMYHYYINPNSIVLKKNEAYHIDHISTQEIMWEQLIGRGFGVDYLNEIRYEYLYNGYLAMLKILALRYDEPSYSLFRLLQELTRSKIPESDCMNFMNDPSIPELHRLLFGMIHPYISKDRFADMIVILRKGGI